MSMSCSSLGGNFSVRKIFGGVEPVSFVFGKKSVCSLFLGNCSLFGFFLSGQYSGHETQSAFKKIKCRISSNLTGNISIRRSNFDKGGRILEVIIEMMSQI